MSLLIPDPCAPKLPKEKEAELVEALSELLLEYSTKTPSDILKLGEEND